MKHKIKKLRKIPVITKRNGKTILSMEECTNIYGDSLILNGEYSKGQLFYDVIRTLRNYGTPKDREILTKLHAVVFESESRAVFQYNDFKNPVYKDIDLLGGFISALSGFFTKESHIKFNRFKLSNRQKETLFFSTNGKFIIVILWRSEMDFSFKESKDLVLDLLNYL